MRSRPRNCRRRGRVQNESGPEASPPRASPCRLPPPPARARISPIFVRTAPDTMATNDGASHGTLLCSVSFPANTGYAWIFIEGLYASMARRLATDGVRTFVAYPAIPRAPDTLAGSPAQAVELDLSLRSVATTLAAFRFLRRHRVDVLYLTDRPSRSLANWWFRLAGVRYIIVHDHTSGARAVPRGVRRMAKWLLARVPGLAADMVITVSDYVAERQREVNVLPAHKVHRVWNGIPLPPTADHESVHAALGIAAGRPLLVCCGRAAADKGIDHLMRAFAMVVDGRTPRPALVYVGDGPQMPELVALRESLPCRDDIHFVGRRSDVPRFLAAAAVCVVPSVWQDALPLAVIEPMAHSRPVIATRVGGIPEMLRDEQEGLLVPPADAPALARALRMLLDDPARAAEYGARGRVRVATHFSPEVQVDALVAFVRRGLRVARARGASSAAPLPASGVSAPATPRPE